MRAGTEALRRGGGPRLAALLLASLLALAGFAVTSVAQANDPLFVLAPEPPPPPPPPPPGAPPPPAAPPPVPPPTGYLNGACGLGVAASGEFYVADHNHDVVDVYEPIPAANPTQAAYKTQLSAPDPLTGPCHLALDSGGNLYVNSYHRSVRRYGPAPGFAPGLVLSEAEPTGVAVDPASDDLYVNERTVVSVYDSGGSLTGQIGTGTLGDGYGVAVSGFAATAGFLYVADAAEETIKVYAPAIDPENPVQTIDGSETPEGRFTSLRDSSVAVDDASGDVYVVDNLQPKDAERPEAIVHVFDATGAYEGHLKHKVIHGAPTGLAVDNSGGPGQGRVYVTSGNTHGGGLYAYAPGSATDGAPAPPTVPKEATGGGLLEPNTGIGEPASSASSSKLACEGDACQVLPPEPVDPTLTTLLRGLGNPRVRYRNELRDCGRTARNARRLARKGRRAARAARRAKGSEERKLRGAAKKLQARARKGKRAARRCRRAKRRPGRARGSASASASVLGARQAGPAPSAPPSGDSGEDAAGPATTAGAVSGPTAAGLLPGSAGFDVKLTDEGAPATLAGSHPYRLGFEVALDQGGGDEHLRELAIDLPAGLLANPAAVRACSVGSFATPRSSPYEASQSGEDCADGSQVGTVEVAAAAGTRRFGLFNLAPADGVAAQLGAAPFGQPIVFGARLRTGADSSYALALRATLPEALAAERIEIDLWGTPGGASHDGERGDCLNEAEPAFPHSKCSLGEPLQRPPLAYLTLPTRCSASLPFGVAVRSWQGDASAAAALNRDAEGAPVGVSDCDALGFDPHPEGLLSSTNASTSTGFTFRLKNEDPGLADPSRRILSQARKATVELPEGVTINPSVGAGLGVCTLGQLSRENAFNPPSSGCPNAAKIGEFRVGTPFYEGILEGSVYLAEPDDPRQGGEENPFDSLLAIYLVAKSADRGLLFRVAGRLEPDSDDGTVTAVVEDLPQLPYTDLEVRMRSGQRAPLITPPRCGEATTRIEIEPWAGGAGTDVTNIGTEIEAGIGGGRCPSGTPPFAPDAIAGGVNSNVNSYTPYFVHLVREDTEQEITSYSLVLPKGITGKLAGIPFCPEASIAAARSNGGFAETERPSCPAASQVGRTETGYGVGGALTYAPGRIYLAGPYRGAPLSLVTVNSATVGPFDLGTVVIRSAFQVDPLTAQLRIDSSVSDPIPHILEGVPLHLRDVRVHMDRPQFTHNPSSCEPSALLSTLGGSGASFSSRADDSTATVSKHFQLLNCLTLGFRPKLGLRLRGRVRRGGFPALRATFAARGPRDSNLKRIEVNMPRQLFLAQNHIRSVCTRVQFAAGACPPGSVYGRAVAHTPLLDEPLRGRVYLRSSSNKLPDLVTSLFSGAVRIDLVGRIGPTKRGGIQAFFDNLPDAPIERFTMFLRGGRRGLLTNSVNICKAPPRATIKGLAQNNVGAIFTTKLRGQCNKKKKGKKRAKPNRGRRGPGGGR